MARQTVTDWFASPNGETANTSKPKPDARVKLNKAAMGRSTLVVSTHIENSENAIGAGEGYLYGTRAKRGWGVGFVLGERASPTLRLALF